MNPTLSDRHVHLSHSYALAEVHARLRVNRNRESTSAYIALIQTIIMFFIKPMEHTILLHPSYFGPNIQRYLRDRLYEDIEGKCTGDFYIIAIMDINDYSEGQVMPGSGFAQYNVHYRAIVWKPFKGEVVRTDVVDILFRWPSDNTSSSTAS